VFDHVTIRASDRAASERFYATVLAPLGIARTHRDEHFAEWDDFSLAPASAGQPITRRLHVAWLAASRGRVDEFWRVGTAAGYRDDGPPGERPQYAPDYYGAFLLDPDGNSAEAVHHGEPHTAGHIDHLWIRVADVAAAKRFYETVGPFAGFAVRDDTPDRVQLAGAGASFSVVAGDAATEHVHLAFPATSNETVDAFHRAALEAGHRDNGAPGERAVYHPGYYAAFVLDPDGNNVEVVNHNRPEARPETATRAPA
jgi:catechol 2,3-dioxygenase-like lactoylglutathione lyase family enzyme